MTERKIETRRQRPPTNSDSVVSSMTSTMPWAGATMTFPSGGTCGSGSRKNQRQNRENKAQRANRRPETVARNAQTSAANISRKVTTSKATSVQKINFSAAWVALPLCFINAIIIGSAARWKEDIRADVFVLSQATGPIQ